MIARTFRDQRAARTGVMSIWLVVLMIIAVVSMVALYFTYSWLQKEKDELDKLTKDKNALEQQAKEKESEVQDWQKLVGEPKAEALDRIKKAELAPPANNLRGLVDRLVYQTNQAQTMAETVKGELDRAVAARQQATAELETLKKAKDVELAEARKKLDDIQAKAKSSEAEFQQQIAEVKDKTAKLEQDYRKEREAFEETKRKMTFELDTIREQSRQIVERLRMAKGIHPDIDGLIVITDPPRDMVSIDIGSQDGVKTGMVFRVFNFTLTGDRIDKGRIRVRAVERNSATALIIEGIRVAPKKEAAPPAAAGTEKSAPQEITYEIKPLRGDQIVQGDCIESIFFPAGRNFIAAGKFDNIKISKDQREYRYSAQDVARLIQMYGGVPQTTVNLDTDYSIEGLRDLYDPASEKLFSELREFRVKAIPMDDFVKYLPD